MAAMLKSMASFYIELFRVTSHDSAALRSESTTLKGMPKYWMISARDGGGIGSNRNNNGLTFWVSDSPNYAGQLCDNKNWRRVPFAQFRKDLIDACAQFPDLPPQQQ